MLPARDVGFLYNIELPEMPHPAIPRHIKHF